MREEGSSAVLSVKVQQSLQDVRLFHYKMMSALQTATITYYRDSVAPLHRTKKKKTTTLHLYPEAFFRHIKAHVHTHTYTNTLFPPLAVVERGKGSDAWTRTACSHYGWKTHRRGIPVWWRIQEKGDMLSCKVSVCIKLLQSVFPNSEHESFIVDTVCYINWITRKCVRVTSILGRFLVFIILHSSVFLVLQRYITCPTALLHVLKWTFMNNLEWTQTGGLTAIPNEEDHMMWSSAPDLKGTLWWGRFLNCCIQG